MNRNSMTEGGRIFYQETFGTDELARINTKYKKQKSIRAIAQLRI